MTAHLVVERETKEPFGRLKALGYALIPWALLVLLALLCWHYNETGWFFGW